MWQRMQSEFLAGWEAESGAAGALPLNTVAWHAAFVAIEGHRFGGLVVRIVTSAAPELLVAAACALAERQLLDVTDDFEGARG